MTSKELAYIEIERLVKDFKNIPTSKRKGMNEMQTRLGYILPLFKALEWDTSNINEVTPEEKVSRGWVDFSFRLGNVPRFFLETKNDTAQEIVMQKYSNNNENGEVAEKDSAHDITQYSKSKSEDHEAFQPRWPCIVLRRCRIIVTHEAYRKYRVEEIRYQ